MLLLNVISRVQTDREQLLMGRVGGNSLPFFGVFDAEGRAVAAHDGPATVEAFRATLRAGEATAKRLAALRSERADADKANELLAAQIELRHFDPAELRKRLAAATDLPRRARLDRDPVRSRVQTLIRVC